MLFTATQQLCEAAKSKSLTEALWEAALALGREKTSFDDHLPYANACVGGS